MTTHYFSTNKAKEGSFLVYINGIEVPVQGVRVGMGVGQLPGATISTAPDQTLTRLGHEDRVEVGIFYKDDVHSAIEGHAPDFRLLFDGNISGWSYSNSFAGRSLQFTCEHHTKVLETLQPDYILGPNSAAMSVLNFDSAAKKLQTSSGLTFPWMLFFFGFSSATGKEGIIQRPYDLITRFFQTCVDYTVAPDLGSVTTSTFYSRHFKRVGLLYRFIPSPFIETNLPDKDGLPGVFPILQGTQHKKVVEAFYRKVSEGGVRTTIWQAFQNMFQSLYYEILSISTAPIAQLEMTADTLEYGQILGPPNWGDAYPKILTPGWAARTKKAFAMDLNRPNCLINHITKPQWLFGVVPSCNVVFPSIIKNISFDENYSKQPTRFEVRDRSMSDWFSQNHRVQSALAALRYGYPEQIENEFNKNSSVNGIESNPLVSGKNLLVWPEEFFKGPVCAQADPPRWLNYVADYYKTEMSAEQEMARDALNYIEEALADVWTSAYDMAVAELEPVEYSSEENKNEEFQKRLTELQTQMEARLFETEQVYIRSLYERRVITEEVKNIDDLRKKLTRRAENNNISLQAIMRDMARYEYHRLRSGLRKGSVSMAFNPYIVPGFPAIMFDNMEDGQHFVGYVTYVEHVLSTTGMETNIQFVHGQTLDELIQEIYDARVGNCFDGVKKDIAMGPPTPLPFLQEVIQDQKKAETYFQKVFHQGAVYSTRKSKTAAFDVTKAIRLVKAGKNENEYLGFDKIFDARTVEVQAKRAAEKIKIEKEIQSALTKKREKLQATWAAYKKTEPQTVPNPEAKTSISYNTPEEVPADTLTSKQIDDIIEEDMRNEEIFLRYEKREEQLKKYALEPDTYLPNEVLDNYIGISPTNTFAPMFSRHDEAMRFISRPICTLDEYVKFRGKWGFPYKTVLPDDPVQGKGALYYEQILKFSIGPGQTPKFDANNFVVSPQIKDIPDTRADWNTRLLNYRKKVLFGKVPKKNKENK